MVLDQFQEDAFLNGKDKSILTLRGWTVPDSRSTEDPDPARIWSGNVMEQKNPGSTDLRMACICFLSVVRRCFLDTDLPLILTPVRCYWANTTAGMRPWALSLAETLLPVHSLGMARITCYAETGGDDESENDLGFNIAVLRRPAGINVWEGFVAATFFHRHSMGLDGLLRLAFPTAWHWGLLWLQFLKFKNMFGTFFWIQNRFKRIYINIGFFFKNKLKMFLKSFKIIKNVKKKV